MITEEDIDRVLYHPLFRQRVNEILRRHELIASPVIDADHVPPQERVQAKPSRAVTSGLTAEDLQLENLGIYISMTEAAQLFKVTAVELSMAIADSKVRYRNTKSGVEVEKDTVAMYVSARDHRRRDEGRPSSNANERTFGMDTSAAHGHAAHANSKGKPRGLDRVGVKLPREVRPSGAVSIAEAAHMLGVKATSVPPYVTTGWLRRAGGGWVTEESVRKRCVKLDQKVRELPEADTSATEQHPAPVDLAVLALPVEQPVETDAQNGSNPEVVKVELSEPPAVPAGALTIEQASLRFGYAVPALNALIGFGRLTEVCPGYLLPEEMERYINNKRASRTT